LVHGHLRLAPMVPAYVERVKGESLLKLWTMIFLLSVGDAVDGGSVSWWNRGMWGGRVNFISKGGIFIPPKVGKLNRRWQLH